LPKHSTIGVPKRFGPPCANRRRISLCRNALLPLVFLLVSLLPTYGQPARTTGESLPPNASLTATTTPSPARATILSATLPGLGQAYNRKYWKIPIIYAGFGTLAYFVDANNTQYQMWRSAYVARTDGNPLTEDDFPFHSTDVLQRAMNFYRRNLEITYILSVALYLLNILDASVDAHLMDFDVGEELSLRMQPRLLPSPPGSKAGIRAAGFGLTFNF